MTNPVQPSDQVRQHAQQLFRENCAMCHGAGGRGPATTPAPPAVLQHFQRAGRVPPADFASPRVRGRNDGQLHWILTNGLGGMPPFGNLLSEEERWALVHFIRGVQG
jgi:mono/diheme cytochrome c family protein